MGTFTGVGLHSKSSENSYNKETYLLKTSNLPKIFEDGYIIPINILWNMLWGNFAL